MPVGIYQHKPHSEETKRKIGLANKGKKRSIQVKERLRQWHLGKKLSEEHKRKISIGLKGHKSWSKGEKLILPKDFGERISKAKKGKRFYSPSQFVKGQKATKGAFKEGKLNPCWNGGGRLKYTEGFTVKLRKIIKERDNYICQDCGSKNSLVVHHKEFQKNNHHPDKLITLCSSCHKKRHIKFNASLPDLS